MKIRDTIPALLLAAAGANAGIVSTTGQYLHIPAPPDLSTGVMPSNAFGYALDETQSVFFSGTVDQGLPQFGPTHHALNAHTVLFSGWVNSHIIHFDDTVSAPHNATGTIVFADPIVALIYSAQRLDASDWLGAPWTTYPSGSPFRGIDENASGGLDTVRVINPYTIEVLMGNGLDQIRVLTAAVPAPGPLAVVGLAGLTVTRRRRG